MRKLYFLFLLLAAVAIVVPSCTENNIDEPQKEDPQPEPEPEPEPEPGPEPEPSNAPFEITLTGKTELSFTVDIIPQDKDMLYVRLHSTMDVFNELGIDTPEEIVAYDVDLMVKEAAAFEMSVEELFYEYYAKVGDMFGYTVQGIAPGKEFIIYAYGVKIEDGMPVATTDVVTYRDTTIASTPVEHAMDIAAAVNGTSVALTIDTKGYEGSYFSFVEPIANWTSTPNPTDEELQELAMEMWYDSLIAYLYYGFSVELAMDYLTFQGNLNDSVSLEVNTDYFVAAVPIADSGVVYAYPSVRTFTTGEVAMSDNVLTLSVSDVKPRQVTIHVETTNNDPYFVACFTKQRFADMTDEQIIAYYVDNYPMDYPIEGDLDYEMGGLEPNTEYFIAAFGYQSGVVTTGLFTYDFTTPEEVLADIQVTLGFCGYFDTAEVAAINSAYEAYVDSCDVLLAYEVISTPQAASVYRALYQTAQVANVPDSQLSEVLIQAGAKSASAVHFVSYDMNYTICAVVVDQNGNISDVYRSENINTAYEGRGDAWDFINYKHPSRASFESVVIEAPTAL